MFDRLHCVAHVSKFHHCYRYLHKIISRINLMHLGIFCIKPCIFAWPEEFSHPSGLWHPVGPTQVWKHLQCLRLQCFSKKNQSCFKLSQLLTIPWTYIITRIKNTIIVGCPELHVLPLCMYVQIKFCILFQLFYIHFNIKPFDGLHFVVFLV